MSGWSRRRRARGTPKEQPYECTRRPQCPYPRCGHVPRDDDEDDA